MSKVKLTKIQARALKDASVHGIRLREDAQFTGNGGNIIQLTTMRVLNRLGLIDIPVEGPITPTPKGKGVLLDLFGELP